MTELPEPITTRDKIECAIVDAYGAVKRLRSRVSRLPTNLRISWLEWRYRHMIVKRWVKESWWNRPAISGEAFEHTLANDYLGALFWQQEKADPLGVLPITLGTFNPDSLN